MTAWCVKLPSKIDCKSDVSHLMFSLVSGLNKKALYILDGNKERPVQRSSSASEQRQHNPHNTYYSLSFGGQSLVLNGGQTRATQPKSSGRLERRQGRDWLWCDWRKGELRKHDKQCAIQGVIITHKTWIEFRVQMLKTLPCDVNCDRLPCGTV